MNTDGTGVELYDFANGFDETRNVAEANREVAKRLGDALREWWQSIPKLM